MITLVKDSGCIRFCAVVALYLKHLITWWFQWVFALKPASVASFCWFKNPAFSLHCTCIWPAFPVHDVCFSMHCSVFVMFFCRWWPYCHRHVTHWDTEASRHESSSLTHTHTHTHMYSGIISRASYFVFLQCNACWINHYRTAWIYGWQFLT